MDKLPKIGTRYGGWCRTGWLQLEVEAGHMLPFWYGLSWWSTMKSVGVCYPIPINWIMWVVREVYWYIKVTPRYYDHPLWKAGYKVGKLDAELIRNCREKYEDTISV